VPQAQLHHEPSVNSAKTPQRNATRQPEKIASGPYSAPAFGWPPLKGADTKDTELMLSPPEECGRCQDCDEGRDIAVTPEKGDVRLSNLESAGKSLPL
jgi:hypothetical protein